MATRYFTRERIFIGTSSNLVRSTPVFGVDDLTEDECGTLAESVQRCLDDLHENSGAEEYFFELGPSAQDDPSAFINLKSEWDEHSRELERYRTASIDCWQSDIYWLYGIAKEHADIIRGLRAHEMPTVYLQCDWGHGYRTFACVDDLTWTEIDTLAAVLSHELYDEGVVLRVVTGDDAHDAPAMFVQARLDWKRFEKDLESESADESCLVALGACSECIDEIKGLRSIPPAPDNGSDEGEGRDDDPQSALNDVQPLAANGPLEPSEDLRKSYRDPDNYWRNIWLYQLRKDGKTNSSIREELAGRGAQFAPLESENAVRSAIETIANYHRWPVLKGRSGRPRASNGPAKTPQSDSETPQWDSGTH